MGERAAANQIWAAAGLVGKMSTLSRRTVFNSCPCPCPLPILRAGHLRLHEGTQMVMPGDNFRTTIELTLPVALTVGVRFAIRDSGRTVGAGVVTSLSK